MSTSVFGTINPSYSVCPFQFCAPNLPRDHSRYDVRFLLSSIPTNNGSGRTPPLSMIGWEGLPEDCDQTFYLSVKEAEVCLLE